MSIKRDDIMELALKLPESDRAVLAERLLSSLEEEIPDREVDLAWQKEVARRASELESGKAKTIPWEQVYYNLRNKLRARKRTRNP